MRCIWFICSLYIYICYICTSVILMTLADVNLWGMRKGNHWSCWLLQKSNINMRSKMSKYAVVLLRMGKGRSQRKAAACIPPFLSINSMSAYRKEKRKKKKLHSVSVHFYHKMYFVNVPRHCRLLLSWISFSRVMCIVIL